MAKQVASNETGTTDKIHYGTVSETFHLYVDFVSPGDVEMEASPDGGNTWFSVSGVSISDSSLTALDSSPSVFRLVAKNGAEFNAWVE